MGVGVTPKSDNKTGSQAKKVGEPLAYREEVSDQVNNLSINLRQDKEHIVDYRKQGANTPPSTSG